MNTALRLNGKIWMITLMALIAVCMGCQKKPRARPTATLPPPAARPTVTLQASSTNIQKGESVTLTWSSTDATQLNLQPGVGAVAPEGSTKVLPTESTTYSLTATGPGGNVEAIARINVTAPPAPQPETPKPTEPTMEELFVREVQDAYFDFNKADIRDDARAALTKTADFLKKYPPITVTIEGHCDERGSTEYNIVLGDRRAQAARQYLISLGIPAARMNVTSYGKEHPFCSESTEECWQKNRRAHIVMAH
ncbi:MAG TPA: peptidoglycan-associated lipoprotein Pal [Candidatus Dormibacteraeota bacterium]|nr:peptidoglycan-associated lipoprotein Pal [Candidatus Dormibacteraeota bacterium]